MQRKITAFPWMSLYLSINLSTNEKNFVQSYKKRKMAEGRKLGAIL